MSRRDRQAFPHACDGPDLTADVRGMTALEYTVVEMAKANRMTDKTSDAPTIAVNALYDASAIWDALEKQE